MITCRELVELLLDLTSGQLQPEQQGHAEQHLRSCACCTAYLESYRLTVEMSRQLPRPALPAHLARRLQALLEGGASARGEDQGRIASEGVRRPG